MAKSNKGSAWERQIARILTKWLTGQDKELHFWRSPGSGAVGTINPGNKTISGDIVALKFESAWLTDIFSFEAKNGYNGASFDLHLKCNKGDKFRDFWIQVLRDATKAEKEPFLIFKKKGMPNPWCGITENIFNKFPELKNKRLIMLTWGDLDLMPVIFMNFEDFLNTINPNELKKIMENL